MAALKRELQHNHNELKTVVDLCCGEGQLIAGLQRAGIHFDLAIMADNNFTLLKRAAFNIAEHASTRQKFQAWYTDLLTTKVVIGGASLVTMNAPWDSKRPYILAALLHLFLLTALAGSGLGLLALPSSKYQEALSDMQALYDVQSRPLLDQDMFSGRHARAAPPGQRNEPTSVRVTWTLLNVRRKLAPEPAQNQQRNNTPSNRDIHRVTFAEQPEDQYLLDQPEFVPQGPSKSRNGQ
jgi:hypothetical protein